MVGKIKTDDLEVLLYLLLLLPIQLLFGFYELFLFGACGGGGVFLLLDK